MKSLDEWNTLPHWSLLGIGYFPRSKIKSLQNKSEPFMRSGEYRFSFLLFLHYSCFEFYPWERRFLNFNINSASISGNLTFAFAIFEPPVLKSLCFVASAAWKIMSASLIHSDNRPWEMLNRSKKTSCFIAGLEAFCSKYSLLLWSLANMAFYSLHLCCFFRSSTFLFFDCSNLVHLRRTAERKHILNFP